MPSAARGNAYLGMSQELEREKNQILFINNYLTNLQQNLAENNTSEIYVPNSVGIEDLTLNNSINEYVQLQLQLKSIGSSKNPVIKSHQQRIAILKESISSNVSSLQVTYNNALKDVNRRIAAMQSTLKRLPTAEKKYINIQRNFDLSEDLFLFLMQKKTEAEIALASNSVDYNVIDAAEASNAPIRPKKLLNYFFAIFVGLLFPVVLVFVFDFINDRIQSKDELMAISRMPFLGIIPKQRKHVRLINEPGSRFELMEAFRSLRSNLRYMLNENGKVFIITSSVSEEGKTFCSENLSFYFFKFWKEGCPA